MDGEADDDLNLDALVGEGLAQAERDADRRAENLTGTGGDDAGSDAGDEFDEGDDAGAAGADDQGAADDDAGPQGARADDAVDDDDALDLDGQPDDIIREDGATWNDKSKRWQKDGKFVEGEAPATLAKTPAAGATGAAADAGAGKDGKAADSAGAAAAQTWEPLAIKMARQTVPIAEASISRANGHTFLGIKDEQWPAFQHRLSRGVAAERMWRQLDQGLKDLDRERELAKQRPAVRSDSEVEADMMLEVLKEHLPTVLDEQQLENLTLKIQIAQRDEREKVGRWEAEQRTRSTEAETTETTQNEGLAQTIVDIVEDPEHAATFQSLDDEDLKAVMAQLRPVRNALFYKEGTNWVRNAQYVYDRLKDRVAAKQAQGSSTTSSTSSTTKTPAANGAPAGTARTDATPPKGGTPANGTKAVDRGERFNRAGETAARPTSTNVKAQRDGQRNNRPSREREHPRSRPRDGRTPAQVAEDEFRQTTRSYLSSDSLDFVEDSK